MNRALSRIWVPAALILFVVALLYPFLLLGKAFYWGDLFLYFYPMEELTRRSLLTGKLPLWNPYVYGGQPLIGNPQSWVFYPTSFLLAWMPVWLYFTVNAALHLIFAASGTYLFLRRICHDRVGALMGAFVYCGSGYMLARFQFPNMAQAAAFLPWLLLLVDRIIAKPEAGYAGLASLVVALSVLAAHAQVTYMTLAGATAYAAARLYQSRRHPIRARRALAWLCAAMLLGIAVSSAQLIPAIQLFAHSTREQLRWFEATRFTLSPEQLVNFVSPGYFGHPADGDYWGAGNLWETAVFVGPIPVCFAVYAFIRKPGRPAVTFFTLLGLVSALLAMGQSGGLFWIAYYVVPGISSFHDPARFAFLAVFSIACLSAVGIRLLRERGASATIRAGIAAAAALNLVWFSSRVNPGIDRDALTRRAPVSLPGGARTYSYSQKDLWEHLVNYTDYGPQTASYLALLAASMAPNSRMLQAGMEASGYEPVPIRNMTEVDKIVRESLWKRGENASPVLAMMNAGTIAYPADMRFTRGWIPGPAWRSWLNLEPKPTMWFTRSAESVTGPVEALGALSTGRFDPFKVAFVEGLDIEIRTDSGHSAVQASEDGLSARFGPAAFSRLLVRSAAFYPGWIAETGGDRTRVLRANHAFQAVVIPPGADSVDFEYRPHVLQFGLYVTLMGLTAISAMLTVGIVLRGTRFRGSSQEDLSNNG